MDLIFDKCKFSNIFPYFQYWHTMELSHRGNANVYLQHMSFQ